jgi:molybdenum cofactor guanylyltransferase
LERLPVYLLAGGRSSRFGSDKARALVEGQPLLARTAAALELRANRITVVADVPAKYADLGFRTIADEIQGRGPLGGLVTALADMAEPGWLLLCSCDLLEIRPAWIDRLLVARPTPATGGTPGDASTPAAWAIAFRHRHWEPLLALYHTDLLPLARAQMDRGEGALWRLLEAAPHVAVDVPPNWPEQLQANTPEELGRWLLRAGPPGVPPRPSHPAPQ